MSIKVSIFHLVLVVFLLLISATLGIYAIVPHFTPIATQPQADPVQTLGSDPGPNLAWAAADSSAVNAQAVETAATSQVSGGARMTQTFTLHAGWNAIYLELEPDNPSPLINEGTDDDPSMVHEKSTIEALFDGVTGLECILAWNVPLSPADYIVDPTEAGLWDKPGWRRYVAGADGGSDGCSLAIPADNQDNPADNQEIPADLVNLHANQGYLVKLAEGANDVRLTISGQPQVGHRHWTKGSYDLAGFPIKPAANPTIADYFAASPISEVSKLTTEGDWEAMALTDTLAYGEAYFVTYDDSNANADETYTAPLNILDPLGDGLRFLPGSGGQHAAFRVENLSTQSISVTLSLLADAGEAAVALRLTSPVAQPLRDGPATFNLEAGQPTPLEFSVRSTEQPADGNAILELASDELGVRWLIPVAARSGSLAGLWVGDVTVNDVSESRLGGTNVEDGQLTVALRPRNDSGIGGAATLTEEIVDGAASVAISLTLTLPAGEAPTPLQPLVGEGAYIAGYVFEDTNQNGQRDGDELGLAGVDVTLAGSTTSTTAADGAYLFENLDPETYTVTVANPANYTDGFYIILPEDVGTGTSRIITPKGVVTGTSRLNLLPNTVTVTRTEAYTGIVAVEPTAYLTQVMPPDFVDLPYEDGTGRRVEPPINFGLVTTYDASLWATGPGGCSELLDVASPLDAVNNGWLNVSLTDTRLNPRAGADDRQLLGAGDNYAIVVADGAGKEVACGEVVVGSPTRLADGRGSEFIFRILLRVDDEGRAALLPYYETGDVETGQVTRISSANFSLTDPIKASGYFTDTLGFSIVVDPDDPRNPFKHKYHPDHDNLDRQFNPIDFDTVDPNLWESYEIRREIRLEPVEDLRDIPAFADLDRDAAQELEVEVDWGGATWGGLYQEVLSGVHKNAITVQGHFVVRHVLAADKLKEQPYDR